MRQKRQSEKKEIQEMMSEMELQTRFTNEEIKKETDKLSYLLFDLSRKLDRCNSVYIFRFEEVGEPAYNEYVHRKLPLIKTINRFINEQVLPGPFAGFIPVTNDSQPLGTLAYLKESTSSPYQYSKLFIDPIQECFTRFEAEMYNITVAGRDRYFNELEFDPIILLGVYLVSIQDHWFFLGCYWSD